LSPPIASRAGGARVGVAGLSRTGS